MTSEWASCWYTVYLPVSISPSLSTHKDAVSAATDEERLIKIHDVIQQLPPPHYRSVWRRAAPLRQPEELLVCLSVMVNIKSFCSATLHRIESFNRSQLTVTLVIMNRISHSLWKHMNASDSPLRFEHTVKYWCSAEVALSWSLVCTSLVGAN